MKSKHLLLLLPAAVIAGTVLAQGPLTPPGAPAPVMKSLDQIEPRIPISSLPFTISQSGSYYLTGNLHFTGAAAEAIYINASNVTLDLMGFTLSSSDAVTGVAIRIWDGFREVEIRNGAIVGGTEVQVSGTAPNQTWTITPAGFSYGIHANPSPNPEPSSFHFSQLRISRCRFDGLKGGEHAVVEQVTAAKNGKMGINLSAGGSVTNCTASYNGDDGISVSDSSISNCVASFNHGNGITGSANAVANSTASGNDAVGIFAFNGTVTNCSARSNGSTGITGASVANSRASYNGGTGISAASVTNSSSSLNAGIGISASDGSVSHCNAYENASTGIACSAGSVTSSTAVLNGNDGISAPSGVVAFCRASSNNTNNNGSTQIDAVGATRTGNNPTP